MSYADKEFGSAAIVTKEFVMSPEERLRYSLQMPTAEQAMTARAMTAITKARISYNLSVISNEMLDEVKEWLRSVAAVSPAKALELYMELLEFTQSKQKVTEAHVSTTDNNRPARSQTVAELEARLSARVVSNQ
jgi:hypothetical protein